MLSLTIHAATGSLTTLTPFHFEMYQRIEFQDEIDEVQKVRKEWKDLLADIPSDVNSADVQEILDSIKAELLHLDVDGSNYSAEEIESIINQRKVCIFSCTPKSKQGCFPDSPRETPAVSGRPAGTSGQ